MRAVVVREFGPPSFHKVENVPTPVCSPHQLLIDVKAAAVNYPDLLVMSGKYQILPPRPFSPGKDVAGLISQVGADVTSFRAGERVVAQMEYGGYASQALATASMVHTIPDEMSFVDAAAMGLVYQTAYFALVDRGMFSRGESVLVTGASGGVGLAAVQIAKALGGKVFAGINDLTHSDLVQNAGAAAIIDLGMKDLRDSLRKQVFDLNGGAGVDIVIDPVGGDVFDASLRAIAWSGRAIVVGFAGGRISEVKANYLLVKNISVAGLQWSDYREKNPDRVAAVQRDLTSLYLQGRIKPHIMSVYPLERFASALDLVASGKVLGKVALKIEME